MRVAKVMTETQIMPELPPLRHARAEWRNPRYEYMWEPPGIGGFGTVCKARDKNFPQNQTFVAIKHFRYVDEDERPFEEQVKRLKSLSDDCNNVVKVVDFFSENNGDCVNHFLVMEWIGTSLKDLINRNPNGLAIIEALDLAIGIGKALCAIHAQDLDHLDLKPANVLLLEDRTPRLIDFGIMEDLGTTQLPRGLSPGYAPREQMLGLTIDKKIKHRIDLFPLGVIFFQILTGSHPFSFTRKDSATSWRDILVRQVDPRKASELRAQIAAWPGLDDLLSELLRHSPGKRLESSIAAVKKFERIKLRGATGLTWLQRSFRECYPYSLATVSAALITIIALTDRAPTIQYFRLNHPGGCAGIGENLKLEWQATAARVEIFDGQGSEHNFAGSAGVFPVKPSKTGDMIYRMQAVSSKGKRTLKALTIHVVDSSADCVNPNRGGNSGVKVSDPDLWQLAKCY